MGSVKIGHVLITYMPWVLLFETLWVKRNQPSVPLLISKNAFDYVDRDILFYKLRLLNGITGPMFDAIRLIYSHWAAMVRVNNEVTNPFSFSSSVKQGDNLSPTLFSMYMYDLAIGVKGMNCGLDIGGPNLSTLLYADDIVILALDEKKLQNMLDFIYEWCGNWKMLVNEEKTQIVHFRSKRYKRTDFKWKLGNAELKPEESYKYLGVYLHENINFDFTSDVLSSAGSKALGQLRYKLCFLKECQCETFTKLYLSCVVPILDNASSVWGFKFYGKPETIQHTAFRYFLGVHRFASNDIVEGDMGWLSWRARRKLSVLNYWNRLVNCDTERLLFNILQWDLRSSEKPDTWSYEVSHIFQELGDEAIFNAQLLCDLDKSYNDMFFLEQERWNCSLVFVLISCVIIIYIKVISQLKIM